MCLVAVVWGLIPRFPLVILANRDEFRDRPAAPLDWWGAPDGSRLLSGRDLAAGAVWLAVSARGRLAGAWTAPGQSS